MAMIRMSPDKIAEVSDMCSSLAEEYNRNVMKTRDLLQLVNQMWDGPETEACTQALQSCLSEIDRTVQILTELREFLTQVEETMRLADKQIPDQIRNDFNALL